VYSNLALLEAFTALNHLGEKDLPATSVAFKLALNRNHLAPVIQAIDKVRQDIAKSPTPNEEWQALLASEVDWKPVATVSIAKFSGDPGVPANDLAALITVGIITE